MGISVAFGDFFGHSWGEGKSAAMDLTCELNPPPSQGAEMEAEARRRKQLSMEVHGWGNKS